MEGKPLVPRLRFPEFRDAPEWELKPLRHICNINPSDGDLPERFIYIDLESVEAGHLKVRNQVQRQEAPSRAQRLLKTGDVVFQIVRPYQRNNLFMNFQGDKAYVASTGYAQMRAHDSKEFLYQLVHTDGFVSQVISKCTGSSYPAINSSDLADIPVQIPSSPAEQQKIAECLTSLDELIAAERRNLEALRTYKKGLMQNLFPSEGETVPRLRFPEFRDAPGWVEEPFSHLYRFAPTNTFSRDQLSYTSGSVKNIHYGDIHTRFQVLFNIRREIVPFINPAYLLGEPSPVSLCSEGDMVFADASEDLADVGKSIEIIELDGQQVVSGTHTILAKRKGSHLRIGFGGHLFRSSRIRTRIQKESQGSKVLGISSGRLSIVPVSFPTDHAEQQKIAECLTSLDTLITAQAKKIDTLKSHKQGLMQGLFPSLDEVVA